MTGSIIRTTHPCVHRLIVRVGVIARAIGADGVMVVVPIAPVPIQIRRNAIVRMPPMRPIIPIPRRIPAHPIRTPKPIIDIRPIDIYGFDDIIGAVDILIADDLHGNALCLRVFLHKDRRHVLIHILGENGLDDHQVAITVRRLDDTQIIHLPVAVEVEIGESRVRIVEHILKLLQVFGLPEEGRHSLQIKVLGYISRGGGNGNRLIRMQPQGGQQQPEGQKQGSCFHNQTSFKLWCIFSFLVRI